VEDLYVPSCLFHMHVYKYVIIGSVATDSGVLQVKLLTSSGLLKYKTECAPSNGYFLIPLYDKVRSRVSYSSYATLLMLYSISARTPGLAVCLMILCVYIYCDLTAKVG